MPDLSDEAVKLIVARRGRRWKPVGPDPKSFRGKHWDRREQPVDSDVTTDDDYPEDLSQLQPIEPVEWQLPGLETTDAQI